jgi:hypothetical protein
MRVKVSPGSAEMSDMSGPDGYRTCLANGFSWPVNDTGSLSGHDPGGAPEKPRKVRKIIRKASDKRE